MFDQQLSELQRSYNKALVDAERAELAYARRPTPELRQLMEGAKHEVRERLTDLVIYLSVRAT
jgi:hypothetical protein